MQRSAEISSESWTAARQPRARHVIVTKLRKLVLEFSATPLSVLRVYPDTLTVERVLSIEFINCARRPRPALPLRLARLPGPLVCHSRGCRRPGESDRLPPPGRCGRAAAATPPYPAAPPRSRRAPRAVRRLPGPTVRRPFSRPFGPDSRPDRSPVRRPCSPRLAVGPHTGFRLRLGRMCLSPLQPEPPTRPAGRGVDCGGSGRGPFDIR